MLYRYSRVMTIATWLLVMSDSLWFIVLHSDELIVIINVVAKKGRALYALGSVNTHAKEGGSVTFWAKLTELMTNLNNLYRWPLIMSHKVPIIQHS